MVRRNRAEHAEQRNAEGRPSPVEPTPFFGQSQRHKQGYQTKEQ